MCTAEKKYVFYEDFGAVGDGVHDDIEAIAKAHEYANEHGLPVRARDDAHYYISGKDLTAKIMTNVDFGQARFTIDDTAPERIQQPIFEILPSRPSFSPAISSLSKDQKKVDFPHEGAAIVTVYEDNRKIFIRSGGNSNQGTAANDTFVVDGDGNILNDLSWDHPEITRTIAYPIDETTLTVQGGVFTTIANRHESLYHYHHRGIHVLRSNTVVKNITHYVTGEGDHGAPYSGFITANFVAHLTIKDSLFTPHFTYRTQGHGMTVPMGSYELGFGNCIDVTLDGIRQTIDIMDRRYWGLMCSNFCKNFLMKDCVVSRFDAHMGVTNAKILRSKLGHQCLNLIGHGKFVIEDSDAFGGAFIGLRSDYGSIFDGTILIKNCRWTPSGRGNSVIEAKNNGEHDFGYECRMPHSVTIDGLTILDEKLPPEMVLYALSDYDSTFGTEKPFPYVPTRELIIKGDGIRAQTAERRIEWCNNPAEYPDLKVERC